jgi:hypothetical protein
MEMTSPDGIAIEIAVVKDYFYKRHGHHLNDDEITSRERPDAMVCWQGYSYGIEVGAVINQSALESLSQQEKFLSKANEEAKACGLRSDVSIGLVMQDDRNYIKHSPTDRFKSYKFIPQYLDGLFLRKGCTGQRRQIELNQSSSSRPDRDLFPKSSKQIKGIVQELCKYVASLTDSDFSSPLAGYPEFHHIVTAQLEERIEAPSGPSFPPQSIIDKLEGKKDYPNDEFDELILLLHNRLNWDKNDFRQVLHQYWHECPQILADLRNRVKPDIFDAVYFVDYSENLSEAVLHRLDVDGE